MAIGARGIHFLDEDRVEGKEELIGAEAVHRELRCWLVSLGHDAYAEQAVNA